MTPVVDVAILATPSGSAIYVDGRASGVRGLAAPRLMLRLTRGRHILVVEHAGYRSLSVEIDTNQSREHSFTLQRLPGLLEADTHATADDETDLRRHGVVAAPLAGPAPEPVRGSAFAAITLNPRELSIDVGVGYPYFLALRVQTGVARSRRLPGLGLDAGIETRTSFLVTEVLALLRVQFLRYQNLAMGINLVGGGGGGSRGRNTMSFEAGLPISIVAGTYVLLTVQLGAQIYSDQLCPSIEFIRTVAASRNLAALDGLAAPESDIDACATAQSPDTQSAIGAAAGYSYANHSYLTGPHIPYDPNYSTWVNGAQVWPFRLDGIETGTPLLDRMVGARMVARAAIEISVRPWLGVYLMVGAAARSVERDSNGWHGSLRTGFRAAFHPFLRDTDADYHGRVGASFRY